MKRDFYCVAVYILAIISAMNNKISLFSLVLLIVAAIDSIRNLPSTAFFGGSLIFFLLLSAIIFLIPVSFVSAEFASRYPEKGGVYYWIQHAFGNRMAVLAVWLQWINTMVWYPTMLLFIAGTAAHLINPLLAEGKFFLLSIALATFWGLTFLNLRGIQVSARMNSFCGSLGTLLPMSFLILLGFFWVLSSHPLSISFSLSTLIPTFDFFDNSTILVTIMASFVGMELAGVHVGDIQNPQKNFPIALGYSVLILLASMIFGALAVAVVVPQGEIRFVDGVMQTFTAFFDAFHISFLVPILSLLIMVGSIGGSVNWLLSPAKGLLQAAEHGFLPTYFLLKNRHGVPVRILVFQALLVSIFCIAIQLVPSINAYYWFLMALSTGLYMIMYLILFLAALKLGRPEKSYQIPRGIRTFCCLVGLLGCLFTIFVGFQPSPDVVVESRLQYALFTGLGFILLIAPTLFLWSYQRRQSVPLLTD